MCCGFRQVTRRFRASLRCCPRGDFRRLQKCDLRRQYRRLCFDHDSLAGALPVPCGCGRTVPAAIRAVLSKSHTSHIIAFHYFKTQIELRSLCSSVKNRWNASEVTSCPCSSRYFVRHCRRQALSPQVSIISGVQAQADVIADPGRRYHPTPMLGPPRVRLRCVCIGRTGYGRVLASALSLIANTHNTAETSKFD